MENKNDEAREKIFISGEELMKMNITEIPYLVQNIVPTTGLICVGGSSDTGKSSFLRQLAIAICTGENDFLGFKLNSAHKSVIYLSTEDDSSAMASLMHKYSGRVKPESLKSLYFIFDTERYLEKIEKILSNTKVDAIIFDAFGDLFIGQLNAANEVRRYLNVYKNLSEKYGCAVLFLHHTGKRTESQPPSKSNLLGSQGIEGKSRVLLELRKDLNNIDIRHLCIVKGNYIKESEKQSSYVLKFEETIFYGTGERVNFNDLGASETKSRYPDAVIEKICALKDEMSSRDIAEHLNKEGFKIGKSTVSKIIQECDCEEDSANE